MGSDTVCPHAGGDRLQDELRVHARAELDARLPLRTDANAGRFRLTVCRLQAPRLALARAFRSWLPLFTELPRACLVGNSVNKGVGVLSGLRTPLCEVPQLVLSSLYHVQATQRWKDGVRTRERGSKRCLMYRIQVYKRKIGEKQ